VSAPKGVAVAKNASSNGRIAFASNRDRSFNIYVMSADGTGQENLTQSAGDDRVPD